MSESGRAIAMALACVMSWSFIPVVAKLGQVDLDNVQLLFWSNLLSLVVVGCAAAIMRAGLRLPKRQMVQAAGLGFLGCFVYYLLLYYGYANESAIPVLVVQYSWPALIVLFSILLLGERLYMVHAIGCAIGVAAIVITASKGNPAALIVGDISAITAVFAGAICFALFSVWSKKTAIDPIAGTFWFFVFATLYSAALCAARDGIGVPSRDSLIPVIANGAVINGLSYVLWVKALSLTRASRIAPLVFLAPVFAAVWVSLFFSEPFHPAYAVGMALCIVSGLICVYEPRSRQSPNVPELLKVR